MGRGPRRIGGANSLRILVRDPVPVKGGVMTVVSVSEARANLFGLIERVNEDAAPVEITSRRGDAVLISRNEFEALEETAHR